MIDGDILQALAMELSTKTDHMECTMAPTSILQLAGLLQLALRHPMVRGDSRVTALRFLAGVRAYFADCPATLEVLRRGDDPAYDIGEDEEDDDDE